MRIADPTHKDSADPQTRADFPAPHIPEPLELSDEHEAQSGGAPAETDGHGTPLADAEMVERADRREEIVLEAEDEED